MLFVAAGSLALMAWVHLSARSESRRLFAALARTNAEFIRNARLPVTERTGESLSRVLAVEVYLWPRHHWERRFGGFAAGVPSQKLQAVAEAHRFPGEVRAKGSFEAVEMGVTKEVVLLLIRARAGGFVFQPRIAGVLGAFWALSLALAWALARGVVQPLRMLARRLPHIEEDMEATLPGAERADEIGQLARAYLGTRAQLAEERLRREQAERLAILGRMATGLAHEIHNPLSAIRMHAQLLESSNDLAEAAAGSIPVLIEETARIESLVNQWMFLARPLPPRTSPAELAPIVEGIVRAHRNRAIHAGVRIVNEVAAGVKARVDARRFSQAVGNVVLNAIQAMPMGGVLTIFTGGGREAIELVFHDTGPGFSEAALLQHAELFFSEKEGGMGIGLNVCAEILKAHDGALRVGNAPGGGGCVCLELPALFEPTPLNA